MRTDGWDGKPAAEGLMKGVYGLAAVKLTLEFLQVSNGSI